MFLYVLVSSFIVNDIACWYDHSYRLLTLLLSRFSQGKKAH